MQPEISRRCLSCGAAVRTGARFCPQCGEKMETAPGAGDAPPEAPVTRDAEPPQEWVPPTKEFSVFVGSSEEAAVKAPAVEVPAAGATATAVDEGIADAGVAESGVAAASPADEARGRVARVREGTRARVEKIKGEALVVLEEAPDDSGLRFVLAAAALFVVFLIVLLLSTTVLR